MVNWWLGAQWFGLFEDLLRDCYERGTPIESQTTWAPKAPLYHWLTEWCEWLIVVRKLQLYVIETSPLLNGIARCKKPFVEFLGCFRGLKNLLELCNKDLGWLGRRGFSEPVFIELRNSKSLGRSITGWRSDRKSTASERATQILGAFLRNAVGSAEDFADEAWG